jgi:hypothetical protein
MVGLELVYIPFFDNDTKNAKSQHKVLTRDSLTPGQRSFRYPSDSKIPNALD